MIKCISCLTGSTEGMIKVLETELNDLLLPKINSTQGPNSSSNVNAYFENIFLFIFGDQLTLKMISVAQDSKREAREHKPQRDLTWYLKGIGDFHLRWTYLMAIFFDHYNYGTIRSNNLGN